MSLELQVSGLTKSYNSNRVLDACSLRFSPGGIYVLTGANGSGKSTFLRICALLETADSGSVIYREEGRELPVNSALLRRITLVLPKGGLFNTTVRKNTAYGLAVRNLPERAIRERVDRVLEFVGLSHKQAQNAQTLSSGEAQRAAIARALVLEPEILFLDEPTASVDEGNSAIIEEIILRLKEQGRSTVIMTTHDRAQAERLTEKILLLKEGRIG